MSKDTQTLRLACLQLNAGEDLEANARTVGSLTERAAEQGASFIITPENTGFLSGDRTCVQRLARTEETNAALHLLRESAARLGVWILVGSLLTRSGDSIFNRQFLIDASGTVRARYDKLHLFDVDLPDGTSYRESESIAPGTDAVLAETPWGGLGMSVCYDLRFPALYRTYARAGARFLAVPSAFTAITGAAHWHALLRARAIENGCFVLAAAQAGVHPHGRTTYGHSLVISPWGQILGELEGEEPGCLLVSLDLSEGAQAQSRIPSLTHDQNFTLRRI